MLRTSAIFCLHSEPCPRDTTIFVPTLRVCNGIPEAPQLLTTHTISASSTSSTTAQSTSNPHIPYARRARRHGSRCIIPRHHLYTIHRLRFLSLWDSLCGYERVAKNIHLGLGRRQYLVAQLWSFRLVALGGWRVDVGYIQTLFDSNTCRVPLPGGGRGSGFGQGMEAASSSNRGRGEC